MRVPITSTKYLGDLLNHVEKRILKLLHPVMCKNLMKFSFCKKWVGEAMGTLQQPGMEVFEFFFCMVPTAHS